MHEFPLDSLGQRKHLHYATRHWSDLVMQPIRILKPLNEMVEEWIVFIVRVDGLATLVVT